MTGNDMLSTLGLRLNDPDSSKFTPSARLDALNIAQKTVVNLLNNAYLTDLQVIDAGELPASGALAFTDLTSEPIRNGVVAVKAVSSGTAGADAIGKFCTMIEPGSLKRLENSYLAGSDSNPIAYVFQQKIYFEPTDMYQVDVWYIKSPNNLEANATECELNIALHELVVDFAESQLWKMAGRLDQAQSAQANALAQAEALNARYEAEKPQGIGV